MANEITLSGGLQVVKSGVSQSLQLSGLSITQAGTNSISNVQNIGTSSEQITLGDVTTIGYIAFKNLDATNFVSIGTINPCVAGTAQITLKPGEEAVLPTRLATWYSIADTAACDVAVQAAEL